MERTTTKVVNDVENAIGIPKHQALANSNDNSSSAREQDLVASTTYQCVQCIKNCADNSRCCKDIACILNAYNNEDTFQTLLVYRYYAPALL